MRQTSLMGCIISGKSVHRPVLGRGIPVVVALQLLRKASYGGDGAEGQRRRVHAYRLADRIIGQLADEHLRTAHRTPDAA
jgi:hypothetical protein